MVARVVVAAFRPLTGDPLRPLPRTQDTLACANFESRPWADSEFRGIAKTALPFLWVCVLSENRPFSGKRFRAAARGRLFFGGQRTRASGHERGGIATPQQTAGHRKAVSGCSLSAD